jgi:hypothetical protein
MKTLITGGVAALAIALLTGPVLTQPAFAGTPDSAEGLRPIEGRSIDLGALSGVAYYTVEREGFRVVATLAEGQAGTPVRVEAVLAPGRSIVLSVPSAVGIPPNAVEIRRQGDEVFVYGAVTN